MFWKFDIWCYWSVCAAISFLLLYEACCIDYYSWWIPVVNECTHHFKDPIMPWSDLFSVLKMHLRSYLIHPCNICYGPRLESITHLRPQRISAVGQTLSYLIYHGSSSNLEPSSHMSLTSALWESCSSSIIQIWLDMMCNYNTFTMTPIARNQ